MRDMKKIYFLSVLIFLSTITNAQQIAYSPLVDSLIAMVTEEGITAITNDLSGETEVTISGSVYTLESRHSNSTFNPLAAQWIKEQFEEMGIQVEIDYFNSDGENVVATIPGSMYPDSEYIVCAHYDDMPSSGLAPGADDNASGVVGVLEAARLLKDQNLWYTVKFIAWDEEEQGLIGSAAYASNAVANNDDIIGVFNMDMIAYDSDSDNEMSIAVNDWSMSLADDFIYVKDLYQIDLFHNFIDATNSDHSSFWNNGYEAIMISEDNSDFNNQYHTSNDRVNNFNIPYYRKQIQAVVATMATLSMDLRMDLSHEPLTTTNSTEDRLAKLVVNTNHGIGLGNTQPRLYYTTNGLGYNMLTPSGFSQDTFLFYIPGQPYGTTVHYYLAAQNSAGTMVSTLPAGGMGVNPAGSVPPGSTYGYSVENNHNMFLCSNTLPKSVADLAYTYDTVVVDFEGMLLDLDVHLDINHPYTDELEIFLLGPDGTEIALSVGNGGSGNNYSGTIFDDEASTTIVGAFAPFTGPFIPEEALSVFDGNPISGNWVLKVYDNELDNIGTLTNYCLNLTYSIHTAQVERKEPALVLKQNYPNPFREETFIEFELNEATDIEISVYDLMGRVVHLLESKYYTVGRHLVKLSLAERPPGQYFYRFQTNSSVNVKSMVLFR